MASDRSKISFSALPVRAVFVSLKKFLFFKSGVFSTFLPLVLRAECTDYQIEFTRMMYCMFQMFLSNNLNFIKIIVIQMWKYAIC